MTRWHAGTRTRERARSARGALPGRKGLAIVMAALLGLAGFESPIAAQISEPSPPGPITPPAAAPGAAARATSEPLTPDPAPSEAPGAVVRDSSEPAGASP